MTVQHRRINRCADLLPVVLVVSILTAQIVLDNTNPASEECLLRRFVIWEGTKVGAADSPGESGPCGASSDSTVQLQPREGVELGERPRARVGEDEPADGEPRHYVGRQAQAGQNLGTHREVIPDPSYGLGRRQRRLERAKVPSLHAKRYRRRIGC